MRVFYLFVVFLILFQNIGFSQKNRVSITDFQDHKIEYTLKNLGVDSICGIPQNATLINCLPIDDINTIEIINKRDRRFLGTIIGVGFGIIPGLTMRDKDSGILNSLVNTIFAIPVTIGGAILGGFIGYNLGRGYKTVIPIYGNKKLYDKQKQKLNKYLY